MRNACLCIAAGAVVCSFGAGAAAQSGEAKLKADAEALIEKMVARYQNLSSYADEIEIRVDLELSDDAPMHAGMFPAQTMELRLEAPNRIALANEQMSVYCNGEKLWISMTQFGQYVEREAPATWEEILSEPDAVMFLSTIVHPVLQLLCDNETMPQRIVGNVQSVSSIEQAERDGVKATVIKGSMDIGPMLMTEEPVPFELWINDETGLLLESQVDFTVPYNAMMQDMADMYAEEEEEEEGDDEGDEKNEPDDAEAAPPYKKYVLVTTVKSATINEDIPDSRFVFDDDESGEKVEAFRLPGMGPSQQIRLVGNEAPEFTLPTLDGKELTLSSLRGKVVLLDFWATWCGPCVQALPHMQEIHEHFADKPVVVLGVNRDQPGSNDRINKLLERREITFGHVLDAAGETAALYHVTGIPSSILIDASGIVQDVGTGFMPGKEKELIEKIDKLLAGETLYDAEEIAKEVAELGEESEGGSAVSFFQNTKASRELREEITKGLGEPEAALTKLELPKGLGMQAWQLQLVDLEGDGKLAMVAPDGNAMRIAPLDGSKSERLALKGLPRNSAVQTFKPVGHGESLRWVVTSMKVTMMGGGAVALSLHDRAGASLWTFDPKLPKGANAHFGEIVVADLDGDGRDEIAAILQAMTMQMSGERETNFMPSAQSAHLLVLGQDGKLLAHETSDMFFGLQVTDAPNGKGKALLCATHAGAVWLRLASSESHAAAEE